MLRTHFAVPDGDHYPLRLSEVPAGGLRISDGGHTLTHISYGHDVGALLTRWRRAQLERIFLESGWRRDDGAFWPYTPP